MSLTADSKDHVYKLVEPRGVVGKKRQGRYSIARASKTIREIRWFEVLQTRGHVEKGTVRHYQVTLRIGFTIED